VLARYEAAPESWHEPLARELAQAGAGDDEALAAAARALTELLDAAGSRGDSVSRGYARGATLVEFLGRGARGASAAGECPR
jgi:hypothetical protein